MAVASMKSLVNAKGRYLQKGAIVRWGAEKGAEVCSQAEALRTRADLKTAGTEATVVAAPEAACVRVAAEKAKDVAAKAKKGKPKPKGGAGKGKPKGGKRAAARATAIG